jgi:hypothetical protein
MEPIILVVTALAAGASAGAIEGLKDDVKSAVRAAYAKLRGLAKKRVAGRPDGELALERYEAAPCTWESVLVSELTKAGAGDDEDLVAAARALMELVDSAGARSGKYNVKVSYSRGVQAGDSSIQINMF